MSNDNTAYVGLRSGGLLTIEKVDAQTVKFDVSEVQLWDVAWGLAGEGRFASQLYRTPYSVAEHSVLGSYLFGDNYEAALRFLFHDAGEAFGIGDMHFKVKELFAGRLRSIEAALGRELAAKFGLGNPHTPDIKETDKALGELEVQILHPAKGRLSKAYGRTREAVEAKFTRGELSIVSGWFMRQTMPPEVAAELWVTRYGELRKLIGDVKYVREEVKNQLAVPGFLPYPVPFLEPALVNKLQVRAELVEGEVKRLTSKNFLVVKGGFYHKGE